MQGVFSEVTGTAEDLESWHALLTGTLPMIQRIEADPDRSKFRGYLSRHILDGITAQLFDVHADSHTIRRTAEHIKATPEPRYLILFQLAGSSVLRQSEGEAVLGAGDFAVVTSTVPYSWEFDGDFTTFAVSFPQAELDAPPSALLPLVARRLGVDTGFGRHLSPFVASLARDPEMLRGPHGVRVARNLIDLFTTAFLQYADQHRDAEVAGPGRHFQQLTDYIGEHLGDPHLDSAKVAEAHFLSVRYVQSIFREHGTTVSSWMRERRLAHCRRDLADLTLRRVSVADIGQRWGLPDPAYFSRLFRQAYGESPNQWRERAEQMQSAR